LAAPAAAVAGRSLFQVLIIPASRREPRQRNFFFFGLGQFRQFRDSLEVQAVVYSRGWTEPATEVSVEEGLPDGASSAATTASSVRVAAIAVPVPSPAAGTPSAAVGVVPAAASTVPAASLVPAVPAAVAVSIAPAGAAAAAAPAGTAAWAWSCDGAYQGFYESLVHHTPERQCDVMVDLPSGDYMHSFNYLEGVTVEVHEHQLPARLYALQVRDFDVILGIDLLEVTQLWWIVSERPFGAYNVDVTWSDVAFTFLGLQGLTTFGVAPGVAVVTWLLSRLADPSRLGGHRFKNRGCAPFPHLAFFFLLLPLSSSLPFSRCFFMLVVLVLRWCRPVHAGDVLVVLGARRRWPFRSEGPNRSTLLLEVVFSSWFGGGFHGLMAFLHDEHAPLPLWNVCIGFFGVVFGGVIPEPPSAEDVTAIEVAMMSRRPCRSRHHRNALERRDGLGHHDSVTTGLGVATRSRRPDASRLQQRDRRRQPEGDTSICRFLGPDCDSLPVAFKKATGEAEDEPYTQEDGNDLE
ncbi:hypothetical protein Taro_001145, partial [Colocasia esculenta]|nr:hypothetical protein [Colocasia esculenta]